ncbi:MAG TPA: gliding motility protein GldN [Bacteroidales bacterium]|nr:gliding motility protein GldN [Bacteroidales bacterium]
MKATKYLFLIVFAAGIIGSVYGQQPNTSMAPGTAGTTPASTPEIKDVYERENIVPEKKPIPYPHIREADVMWAKDIWRMIDLRQRMNYPLRFPEVEPIENRYSLYLLLMEGIRSEEITPYAFNDFNNPFSEPTSVKEVYNVIGCDTIFDANGGVLSIDTRGTTVKGFYLKEKWYFDKQNSEMKVRITALAPLIITPKFDNNGQPLPGVNRIIPFFVYFPQCRDSFATHAAYNPNNDAQTLSFDDLFIQRRFASTIAGESNEFGNRFIVDYTTGQDALLEAERIKNDLFIMEHDLWEY